MKVGIFERKTGTMIYSVEIHLAGQNYQPSVDEAFDHAWKAACEDRHAKPEYKAHYRFAVLKPQDSAA